MKKRIYLLCVIFLNFFTFSYVYEAQKTGTDHTTRTLNVETDKSDYVLFEPILAEFRLSIPSSDIVPKISKDILVKVTNNGDTKEFRGLTSFITQGEPQPLPTKNSAPLVRQTQLTNLDYIQEVIIERVSAFFPVAGDYQVQFILNNSDGSVILSNVIEVRISEPSGAEKDAFDFLNRFEGDISFYWVWEEKNGINLLERFVKDYGKTVYGDFAIRYLANVFSAKGEFEKAALEFEKIKYSRNSIIAKEAVNSLAEISERRRAELLRNLQKSQ